MAERDPFFSLPANSEWNACIGRQGDAENYADGYLEAALELASAVIDKAMFEKRDTLVLPILFNARHAIELTLKLIIGEFVSSGILAAGHQENHDISSHLAFLEASTIPDEKLNECFKTLRPYVDSLAKIDEDGQELRYHQNRAGRQSMHEKALANLAVIRQSLQELLVVLRDIKHRAYSLSSEWGTGTRTNRCSRRDLFEIASILPRRENWRTPDFGAAKAVIKDRYDLGNNQFSLALDKIQETRELSGSLGVQPPLVYLSDDKAEFIIAMWDKLHPPSEGSRRASTKKFRPPSAEEVVKGLAKEAEVVTEILNTISIDEFADAETIFYLARNREFSEYYERQLERKKAEFLASGELGREIHDLMSKTNFRRCFLDGLRSVGRPQLAAGLER